MSFVAAFRFLTIIPLLRHREIRPEHIGRAAAYFPVVGLIIGLVLAGLAWLLGMFLPPLIVSALLLIALVGITGALHLDGLADTCDGLGGHTVADRLRIMKDSHIGSFGTVGIVSVLLLKFAALGSLPGAYLPGTLLVMPVISRWLMAYAIYRYPYARPAGLGKTFKETTGWPSLATATIIALAVSVIVGRLAGFVVILAAWGVAVGVAAYLKGRLSGLTGDIYGAINEIGEVSVLVMVSLLAHNHWLGL